ncbi:MAG: flagellar export chaperone FliS [Acidobacteria bacterium]|nr:flagellar export chaperone FliS [Acidobacteriota bacterium]
MTHRTGADAYRRIEAQSRSPVELVVMLYDGALRFVAEARRAVARRDIAARGAAIDRTLAIIAQLQNTLDLECGGPIAQELDRLYAYINSRLLDVTLRQETGALDEVQKVLTTLRDGWAQIAGPSPGAPQP